jgi:hypothetical protein
MRAGAWLALTALALGVLAAPVAHAQRSLAGVRVDRLDARGLLVAAPRPDTRWAVLVVDPGRAASRTLLARLAGRDEWPDALAILVVGDPAQAARLRLSSSTTRATWLVAAREPLHAGLDLAGTPTLLGIDEQGRVRWQRAGQPGDIDALHAAIRRWVEGSKDVVR